MSPTHVTNLCWHIGNTSHLFISGVGTKHLQKHSNITGNGWRGGVKCQRQSQLNVNILMLHKILLNNWTFYRFYVIFYGNSAQNAFWFVLSTFGDHYWISRPWRRKIVSIANRKSEYALCNNKTNVFTWIRNICEHIPYDNLHRDNLVYYKIVYRRKYCKIWYSGDVMGDYNLSGQIWPER